MQINNILSQLYMLISRGTHIVLSSWLNFSKK